MRVLQAMAGARHGGAETAFSDTVLALARHGLSQQTLIRPWPERQAQMAAGGIATGTAPFGGLVDITTRRRFRRAVSDFRPTIVQTWMQRATRFCPPAERAGFVHLGWLGGYYGLRAYRHCHHLAGVTEAIRNHLTAAGWPPERAHVLRTFAVRESDPPVDRASLDTPADAPLIVALARLHQKKGLDVLLHAMVDLPQAFLWLAGEGPLRSELETLCQRLGLRNRVRFLGWRTDRGALLKAADVCAFPSRYEPFGTVTVEAWAHDTPIVAAASDGPRATIRHGEDGLLVAIDDAGALVAALARILATPDLRQSLIARGRERYEAEYSEPAAVAAYLDLYHRIAPHD